MLEETQVDELARELRAEFGMKIRSWPDVVRHVVAAVEPAIAEQTLTTAAWAAGELNPGNDSVAEWIAYYLEHPDDVAARLLELDERAATMATLGAYMRVRATKSAGPGPWHAADCRWVAQARSPDRWEGVDELPDDGMICMECRAGGVLPTPEQTRDALSAKGAFVRRRAHRDRTGTDHPAGVWHRTTCKMLDRVTEARAWEGTKLLPDGDKTHACVTRHG